MSALTANLPTVLASFMASVVEFVEALTIVLAMGIVRGWRSAFLGTALGVVVLLTLAMVFRLSLSAVPLPVLQGVIGTMLLLFGLLSAFGSFWVGEGLNFGWAGGDFAIVYLIVVFSSVGLVLVGMIRHMHKNRSGRRVSANATPIASVDRRSSPAASLARSVWGLFVDDGWLASEVLSVVAVAALMAHFAKTSLAGASILMVAALVVILGESALRRATA